MNAKVVRVEFDGEVERVDFRVEFTEPKQQGKFTAGDTHDVEVTMLPGTPAVAATPTADKVTDKVSDKVKTSK